MRSAKIQNSLHNVEAVFFGMIVVSLNSGKTLTISSFTIFTNTATESIRTGY